MGGPVSYRRVRVVEFCQRLIWRKTILNEHQQEAIKGQLQALNTVIREMVLEFEITEDEFR